MLGSASFAFGLLTAVAAKVPELDPSKQHTQANTYVYASDSHTILTILRGSQARIIVPSSAISPWMKHAIVAVEDKRFYEHRGIDVRGMARALYADITHHGTVQGGSTITQQFVKNAYLSSQKSIGRKLFEAALAWQLEQKWSKDRILTAYLNTIYLGNHAYGVEQASRIYFGHGAATMNPAEAALLAGIPEDPSLYDPVAHPQAARHRRALVLRLLFDQEYLTHQQYLTWLKAPMPNPHNVFLGSTHGQAPYFANYVTDQLEKQYGPNRTFGSGLKVTTSLDTNLQRIARDAVAKALPSFVDGNGPSAALVAIDPRDGRVLAMVGGPNFHKSQFNLATQGQRQPGSSFKPFVLAAALEQHIAPSTQLVSKAVTINADGKLWAVHNYEGEYLGPIDLAKAIAVSDNAVYSQLTALVGPESVATAAHRLGINSPLNGYFSIGLGGEWTTPLDMARAYASFANNGNRVDGSIFGDVPRAVLSVKDSHGHVTENAAVARPALGSAADSPVRAEIINQLLQGVVSSGTGTAAAIPGRAVAGKTGTTENYGDAWFVGYTPQLVTAVWVGYPNAEVPMLHEFHGHPVVGGSFPAVIWKTFMTEALAYEKDPPADFPQPPSLSATPETVVYRNGHLERDNGVCKNTFHLDFFAAHGPARLADCKVNEVDVPDVRGDSLAAAKQRLLLQPLLATIVYRPAKPGERLGFVTGQMPRTGTLSSYDHVTLILPKALHGVIPSLVGLTSAQAKARLAKLHLRIRWIGAGSARVASQEPRAGRAAAPGFTVTLRTAG